MNLFIVLPIIAIVFFVLICILVFIFDKKKKNKTKNKTNNHNKRLFKRLKILSFDEWAKNKSGIVLSGGLKNGLTISNKFVIKNLDKDENKKIKKIDLEDLAIVKSQQMSGIVIAPSGSGKTQALLLPTIIYNTYSKDKPNMIITDPKPEILEKTKSYLIENGYKIINLSTVNIKANNKEYITDFWNPMDQIILYHKQLLASIDHLEQQEIQSNLVLEITALFDVFNKGIKGGVTYFDSNNLIFLKFILATMLLKVELKEWDYSKINFVNLLSIINSYEEDDINEIVKSFKSNKLNHFHIRTLRLIYKYLGWGHERGENLKSFRTGGAEKLSIFDNNYFNILTCQSTFNLDDIILSKQPFVIFLTINTSSTATEAEKKLLSIYLEMINKKIDYYKKISEDVKEKTFWWMLDEIGNIQRLDFLESIITFGRGLNNFALPVFQSETQLKINYSPLIIENTMYRILFNNSNTQMSRQIKDQEGFEEKTLPSQNVIKIDNINASEVNNIESGYIGLWTTKKRSKDKVFYILPITYYYMMNHLNKNNKEESIVTHASYNLDEHIAILDFIHLKAILEINSKLMNKYDDIIQQAKDCISNFKIINNNQSIPNDVKDDNQKIIEFLSNNVMKLSKINFREDINNKDEYQKLDNYLNSFVKVIKEYKKLAIDMLNQFEIDQASNQTLTKANLFDDFELNNIPIFKKEPIFKIDWEMYRDVPNIEVEAIKNKLEKINNLFNELIKDAIIEPTSKVLNELEEEYFELKMALAPFNNNQFELDKLEKFIENVKLLGVNIYYEKIQ